MSNTAAVPSTPSPSSKPDIAVLLRELPGSGQSTASFARAHGLPPWKLYQALRQRQRRSQRAGLPSGRASTDLVPVKVTSSCAASPIELLTTSGLCLRVPPDFDEAHLRRILGVLVGC